MVNGKVAVLGRCLAIAAALSTGCRREPVADSIAAPVGSAPPIEHRHSVRLTADGSPLRARRATSFSVSVSDTARPGEQPGLFEGAHVHVVIVNRDLTFFEHRHPTQAGAAYQFSMAFPRDDDYVAFVYYRLPDEHVEVTAIDLPIGAARLHHAQLVLTPRTTRAGGYRVSLSLDPDPPVALEWSELRFVFEQVSRSKSSAVSGDHQVIIREGATAFVYAHSTVGEAQGGVRRQLHLPADPLRSPPDDEPAVAHSDDRYHAQFPEAGKYKIWYEAPDGHAATFVVSVKADH